LVTTVTIPSDYMTVVTKNIPGRRDGRKYARTAGGDRSGTPAAIAEEVWHVAHQERCAWSFNVEVRPFGETW
jgi:hypothetical protein